MLSKLLKLQGTLFTKYKLHRYIPFFPTFYGEIENSVKGSETLLDIGCGTDSPVQAFSDKIECTGVDVHLPSIRISKKKGIHSKYVHSAALDLLKKFKRKSFDCVFACEIIEHMEKEDGYRLIKMMEKLARKKIVIVTPNGFVPQKPYGGNKWQEHKSGWTSREMKRMGFKVVGLRGWKGFRGELSYLKYEPKILFYILSTITQYFVRNNSDLAFQILCVKNIKTKSR